MSTPINIKIRDESVLDEVQECTFTQSSGDYCKSINITFKSQRYWASCDPTDNFGELIIRVIIGTVAYEFLCEQRSTEVGEAGIGFSVWGRSKQAYLSSRYSQTITDTEITTHPWQTGNSTISSIISYVLANFCPYPVTVNWNVAAFQSAVIYKDALSASNSAPIDIISTLAEAVGAILLPQNDGSLSVEAYSVTEGTSVAEYSDLDDILSLDEDIEDASGYNAVVVSGYDVATPGNSAVHLSVEAVTTGTNSPGRDHIVEVYYYHSSGLLPLVLFSAGTYGLKERSTEDVTETVELYWGKGNTSMPSTAGNSEVTGDTSVPFATQEVTYEVNFAKYYLRSSNAGELKAFFYFEDQSAYETYTYTVSSIASTLCDGIELDWSAGVVTPPGWSGTRLGVDVYNPSRIAVLESYTSCGANLDLTKQRVFVEKLTEVVFQNGVATLPYPFAKIKDPDPLYFYSDFGRTLSNWFTWLNPLVNYGVTYQVGSKELYCQALVDNHSMNSVEAVVSYYTSYDRYEFVVPDGTSKRLLTVWFYFDGCGEDTAKSIGGEFSVSAIQKRGDVIFYCSTDTVTGVAGTKLYIDGIYRGISGADGTIKLTNISAGWHVGRIEKTGWTTTGLTGNTFSIYISPRDFL